MNITRQGCLPFAMAPERYKNRLFDFLTYQGIKLFLHSGCLKAFFLYRLIELVLLLGNNSCNLLFGSFCFWKMFSCLNKGTDATILQGLLIGHQWLNNAPTQSYPQGVWESQLTISIHTDLKASKAQKGSSFLRPALSVGSTCSTNCLMTFLFFNVLNIFVQTSSCH